VAPPEFVAEPLPALVPPEPAVALGAVEAPAEGLVVVLALEPPAPAAGRTGSVTSTYAAPAEPASARTALAASHLARALDASPK
jgi:hypothetical protein